MLPIEVSPNNQLQAFIQRIERLNKERADLQADIREVFREAKGQGFNVKVMRKVIAERKLDSHTRREMADLLDLYRKALGMLADTPLGDAALKAADGGH